MKIISPLEHFEVTPVISWGYGLYKIFELSNFYLFYISVIFILIFFILINSEYNLQSENGDEILLAGVNSSLIFFSFRVVLEKFFFYFIYFTKSLLVSQRQGRYIGFFFTVFLIVLFFNVLSLVAFIPSITGHLVVTLFFSIFLFIVFIIIGLLNYDAEYFDYFIPKDVPQALLPFLVVIEVLSYLIRPLSLGVRLFANMLAGHTLMGIFAQFGVY